MVVAISVTGPENVPPHLKPQFIELKGAQVKELLDSLKHVLGTDFKRSLFPLIDTLSVERVLVGTGGACCESLMPLAFSLLVHHVRRDLSLAQLLEKGEVGKDQVTFRLKLELPFQMVFEKWRLLLPEIIIQPLIVKVSPAAQGMHSQALASQSSVPLGFKGMREDEVWKSYGALRSGVHCLALFKGKDEVKEMLNSFSEFLAIMEPLYLVDMFSLCMPGLFDSLIYNKQLVQIFAELRQVAKLYKPFSDGLISLLVSIKLDVLKNPDYGAAKLILHLFICILGDDTKTQSDIERILQHHELVIMEVKDNKLVIMFTTSNCLFVTCNCSALCSYVSLDADLGVKLKIQIMAEKCDTDFVENSCRRFVVILPVDCSSSNASTSSNSIGGSVISASSRSKSSQSSNSKQLDPLILLDALVDMLADENRVHSKAALNVFSETLSIHTHVKHADVLIARGGHNASVIVSSPSTNSVYSSHPSVRITAFEQLLHGSYRSTWQAQVGGVMGVGKVNVESLCYFQVKIMRGLVEVLAPVYASKELKERSQVLMQILASHVVNNVDEANSEARRKSFQDVIEYLATWLLNRNAYIAAVLASQTGSEVTELLEPSYQLLLQPLILCPLRCTTVEQQVGTFAALIFCVALKPPLLKVTPELVNFLQEALQIDEADETVWAVKLMNPQVLRSLNRVRTACIEFLSTTIAWVNFRMQTYTEVPAKVNSMFFKSLTCRDPDHIVAVAKEGLRQGKAIHGKIDLKEKHEAFKAKLHSMQAVQWTRSLGILMEGVGELLAANKVKHVPTRVKWMTNLGRRCCFIFNLLYLLKAEAIHEPEKVESRGATNFVTYLWIVVLLFVCVSPLIYFLWRSLKQKPPPESTSPESTSLPDPKLIVADKPKKQKKKKKILSEPPAAFLEANKRFEPYVDCLDSFEASDRLPPKDVLRLAWNRTSVGKLSLLEKVIEQRDDSAVVEGFLENSRPVFIKCGLRSEEMENEIAVLISADYHPNIIRYFISEFEDNHFYYSLESWVYNLSSLVKYFGKQNSSDSELVYLGIQNLWTTTGAPSTHLISLIRDVVLGLEHLHSLDIIHRDLRPENVMIVHAGKTPIAKIGNMDIARIKEAPLLSHHARGERSPGFQPREQFENEKETTAVDMFALGCIMFYVISSGKHPFGAVNKRKANIRRNNCDLRPIQNFPEAYDLIQHLVDSEPNSRLIASQVLLHPFFWNYDVKLDFFMKVSDYAVEVNWLLSTELDALSLGTAIGDTSWDGKVDDIFLDHNNKYSARHANASMTSYVQTMKDYNYAKISDLLRVIRNTQHHYGRLPKDIRAIFPDGVYKYFDGLFPKLFMEVYKVVYPKYKKADEFKQFFKEI